MQNVRRDGDIKFVTTERRRNYLMLFFKKYGSNRNEKNNNNKILINKSIYLELSILDISKLAINEF